LSDLVKEGHLSRMKGKGTFVTSQKIELNYIAKWESFEDIVRSCGYTPFTQVLSFERIAGIPNINKQLQIPETEPLNYMCRLCMADGEPMLFSESYTKASQFEGLHNFNFAKQSLYATLRDVYHVNIATVRREISAINATQSDVKILGIPKNRAICLVYNLAFDENEIPVEYSVSRYRSEKIKFTNYMKC
jgi:GntR family transcriptional regulator